MITLDQAKIDAPDFPRSQEWWTRFLPDWVTGTVQPDGTVTIEPRAEVVRYTRGRGIWWEAAPTKAQRANVRRCRELAIMRWLYQLSPLEPAIVEDRGERCQCWRRPVRLHNGHCCFAGQPARICHSMPEDMRQPSSGAALTL